MSADGVPVQFEVESGDGPPLVFVHGWSCDRTYWSHQLSSFAARHQVVTIDLAGHGESGTGRTSWTMPAFGGDVVAVIQKLELRAPVLVGHSMGGDVIVEAALAVPVGASGLVWVDTYSSLGEPRTQAELEEFMSPFRDDFVAATRDFVRQTLMPGADQKLAEWVAADMSSAPPEIALDALRHAIGNAAAVLSGLERLTAPVVAINPDHRPTDVESLRRHGVKVVLMSGVGHFPMLEDPDTFNRVLGETIAGMR